MVTIETSWEKPPGWVDPEDDTESEAAAAAVAMDGTDGVATRDVPGEGGGDERRGAGGWSKGEREEGWGLEGSGG